MEITVHAVSRFRKRFNGTVDELNKIVSEISYRGKRYNQIRNRRLKREMRTKEILNSVKVYLYKTDKIKMLLVFKHDKLITVYECTYRNKI